MDTTLDVDKVTISDALTLEQQYEAYRRMVRIRTFEIQAEEHHAKGEIPGTLHISSGQEAEIVGACMALEPKDYMVGNHRSHGHPIGKNSDVKILMAELFARATGVCRGKGGSMHLADFSVGSLGETSIVGSGLPVAVGAALGSVNQENDRVTLCFFGDGASNEGAFHEALNLASIWTLPVVFLCENNLWAVSTPARKVISVENIADRAVAYSMPSEIVFDGQDLDLVYRATKKAVDRARGGGGPTLVEVKTYRYGEHAANMGRVLADREDEMKEWLKRDPIQIFRDRIYKSVGSEAKLNEIENQVHKEIEDALLFAKQSDYPEVTDAFDDVFSQPASGLSRLMSETARRE